MSGITCYVSSDNDITVEGLKIGATGAYANSATVTASLITTAGATVSNSTVTLDYVTNSNGRYFGAIPSNAAMTDGTDYYLQIVATQGSKDITVRIPFKAAYYQGCN